MTKETKQDVSLLEAEALKRADAHTISLLVRNKPGVLLRTTLVFSRRGYNIESLVVSPALDGDYSRMTITAQGDPQILDQIIRQANKLIDVVNVAEHNDVDAVEREMALIKVDVVAEKRTDLMTILDHFKAETVDITRQSIIIQVTGSTEKLDALLDMLSEFEIKEVVRTGKILMARGTETT